jgi:hypothetical protein
MFTAEVAVAFAGFSGLAALLGRRRSRDDVRVDVMRLRAILEGSLVVAGAAVLPVFFFALGASEEATWRTSSALFLTASLLLVGVWTKRIRRAVQSAASFNRRVVGMFYGIAIVQGTLLGVNLLNLSESRLFPLYLISLYTLLFGMAVLFLRLVASLVAASQHD